MNQALRVTATVVAALALVHPIGCGDGGGGPGDGSAGQEDSGADTGGTTSQESGQGSSPSGTGAGMGDGSSTGANGDGTTAGLGTAATTGATTGGDSTGASTASDGTVGGRACIPAGEQTACGDCIEANCAADWIACLADEGCCCFAECVNEGGNPQVCFGSCPGQELSGPIVDCIYAACGNGCL